jgi:ribosomal protein L11 methyltransferase
LKDYIQYSIACKPLQPLVEILISELADHGFESFVEHTEGFDAYLPKGEDDRALFNELIGRWNHLGEIKYKCTEIAGQNWNAQWEADYPPVQVGNDCFVRAPFHPEVAGVETTVVIQPKMSFGTGHHATTWLMLAYLVEMSLASAKVLDMGCGTGVLGITALLRGAAYAKGIDIEDVAVENTRENTALNEVVMDVDKGGAERIVDTDYHLILANINKNVLLTDLPSYVKALRADGCLLLSGFFSSDVDEVTAAAERCGLKFAEMRSKADWAALKFTKH